MSVMSPKQSKPPKSIRPHLVVKLKRGWRYLESKHLFVSSEKKKFLPHADLPPGTHIVYVVPHLARSHLRRLSKDEQELARYVNVILPKGTSSIDYLNVLKKWMCVDKVQIPPEISLPMQ